MANVFTDPISGNTRFAGTVTVDNINIRGITLGSTALSSNTVWLPSTTLQWTQVVAPNLPTFTLPAGGVMAYTLQAGAYRWTDNDLTYTLNIAGTLTSATTSNTGDYIVNLPYPINTTVYDSPTIIGEFWLSSAYNETSNIYKAYAKTITGNTSNVAIRVLAGTADETMSTISSNIALTLQGTVRYNTNLFNHIGASPVADLPSAFTQDSAGGQFSVNSNFPPRARIDIYQNSNTPALIVDQYGTGDAIQLRSGGQTKMLINSSGNLDISGNFLSPVSGAPHVTFDGSTTNSNVFLTWLQRTTQTLAGSWWQDAAVPQFSSVTAGGVASTAYRGGVLLPDGRVVFIPHNATTIGIFNPTTNTYSTIAGAPAGSAYYGGVLLPDGRVVFVPYVATTIGIFNPATNAFSTIAGAPGSSAYVGGVLLPDGRVVFVPNNATTIGIFNPATNAYSTIAKGVGTSAYRGGVLLPDGRVVFVPYAATTIGIFNPTTNAYTTITGLPGGNAYFNGVLLPDGRVLFLPYNATRIGIFNPMTNAYSTIAGVVLPGSVAFQGGVLIPDGRVVFVPNNSTIIGIFNPATDTYSTIAGAPVSPDYVAGVLLPDGRVVFVPTNVATVGILSGFAAPPRELCYHPCFNRY